MSRRSCTDAESRPTPRWATGSSRARTGSRRRPRCTTQMKYKSYAVTAQRIEPADSPDDFPTPPWATRALMEHVLDNEPLCSLTCLEPACGVGHMAKVLNEYFGQVHAS